MVEDCFFFFILINFFLPETNTQMIRVHDSALSLLFPSPPDTVHSEARGMHLTLKRNLFLRGLLAVWRREMVITASPNIGICISTLSPRTIVQSIIQFSLNIMRTGIFVHTYAVLPNNCQLLIAFVMLFIWAN